MAHSPPDQVDHVPPLSNAHPLSTTCGERGPLPEVPTFYPTESEMSSLLTYVRSSLLDALQTHGIVRIKPPASIRLPLISVDWDKPTVSTTKQRLGSLDGASRLRLRENNGMTLYVTSRNTGIPTKSLFIGNDTAIGAHSQQPDSSSTASASGSSTDSAFSRDKVREKYYQYVELCKARKSHYPSLPDSYEKICLACNKSIKRERKVKCLLCPRQFHICCLPADALPLRSSVWYCDHCICFPVETFYNRSFSYPMRESVSDSPHAESSADMDSAPEKTATPSSSSNIQDQNTIPHVSSKPGESSDAAVYSDTSPASSRRASTTSSLSSSPLAPNPLIISNWSDNGPCVSMARMQAASTSLFNTLFRPMPMSPAPTLDFLENFYWRLLDDEYNSTEVLFTTGLMRNDPDVDYIHPTSAYRSSSYNLSELRNQPESLLTNDHSFSDFCVLSGAWFPSGIMFSSVPWHIEDHFLFAVSWQHLGAPRIWYSIPSEYHDAFEQHVGSVLKDMFGAKKRRLLNHFFTMYNPYRLPTSIPVYKTVQEEGDIIIMFPKAYHAAFNTGFAITEAVDFAIPEWLPYAKQATDAYYAMGKRPLLNVIDLILLKAITFKDTDKKAWLSCKVEIEKLLKKFFIDVDAEFSKDGFEIDTFLSNFLIETCTRETCNGDGCLNYIKNLSWKCMECNRCFCGTCIVVLQNEKGVNEAYCPNCQHELKECLARTAKMRVAESESSSPQKPCSPPVSSSNRKQLQLVMSTALIDSIKVLYEDYEKTKTETKE